MPLLSSPYLNNYVFPPETRANMGIALATRLREMLIQGSPELGQAGLITTPQFINRKGTGAARDETLYTGAEVRFMDDGAGSVPCVLIVGINADGGFEDWGDDQFTLRATASLDCRTNGATPQAFTPGSSPSTAGNVLGDFVWGFLDNRDVLTVWGFTDSQVVKGEPQGGALYQGRPVEFVYPLTFSFEVYVERD